MEKSRMEMKVRQAAKRGRDKLPKEYNTFVMVVAHLLKNAHLYFNMKNPSVIQRRVLESKTITDEMRQEIIDDFKEANKSIRDVGNLRSMNRVREQNEKVNQIKEKYRSYRSLSQKSGISVKTVHKWCSKPQRKLHKGTELSNLRRSEVEEFLMQDSITFPHPCKKHSGKRFMRDTWEITRDKYLLQPEYHRYGVLSLSTLKNFKPKHILPCGETPMANCLCDYCENVEKNLKALRRIGLQGLPSNKYDAVDKCVCDIRVEQFGSKFSYPPIECTLGECPNCGVNKFAEHIKHLNAEVVSDNPVITWSKWMKPKGKSAPDNIQIRGTLKQCMDDLFSMIKFLTGHIFRANWHRNMYDYILKQIIVGLIVQIFDYSMNFRNTHQNEVQSAYWNGTQTTIHAIINHLKCLTNGCNKTMTLVLAQISDDLQHDSFHARACHTAGFKYLAEKGYPLDLVVQFCDNCSGQYKSRRPFAEISKSSVEIIRVFFGEKHGKSECDGFFGQIKRWMTKEIKNSKAVINSAKDFYIHCKNFYPAAQEKGPCQHYKVVFQFISTRDVRRKHDCDLQEAVKGTRSLYSVRNTPEPLTLLVRNVPCLCLPCLKNDGPCCNETLTDNWRKVDLIPIAGQNPAKHSKRPHPSEIFGLPSIPDEERHEAENQCGSDYDDVTSVEDSQGPSGMEKPDDIDVQPDSKVCQLVEESEYLEQNDKIFVDLIDEGPVDSQKFIIEENEEIEDIIITGYENEMCTNIDHVEKQFEDVVITKVEDLPCTVTSGKYEHASKTSVKPERASPASVKRELTSKPSLNKNKALLSVKARNAKNATITHLIKPVANWKGILRQLQNSSTYDELEETVNGVFEHIKPIEKIDHEVVFNPRFHKADMIASSNLPSDGPQDVIPVTTRGDGNCLCRALSTAYFGTENRHIEIRARIVMEAIVNRNHYMDHRILSRGVQQQRLNSLHEQLPVIFAKYSDFYRSGQVVTDDTVYYMFTTETHECSKDGAYMGLWQLACAAQVFKIPIHSVFPSGGDEDMRGDFHRTFFPLRNADIREDRNPLIIMWTSILGGNNPDHFVPLLPYEMYVNFQQQEQLI